MGFVILEGIMDRTIFKGLRDSLKTVQAKTEANVKREHDKARPWAVYDSALHHYATTFDYPYERSFRHLIPEEFPTMRAYIEQRFFEKRGAVVGMDIGGTGSALFRDFSPGFFVKSLGVVLADQREENTKQEDEELHHSVLEADAFSSKGWRNITSTLRGDTVDVLFERMYGGLVGMSADSHFLASLLERWYGLLGDEGVMFVELPHISSRKSSSIVRWLYTMEHGKVPGVTVRYAASPYEEAGSLKMVMCLEKGPGAPESLRESFEK